MHTLVDATTPETLSPSSLQVTRTSSPSQPPPQVSLRLFQTDVIYHIPNRWFEFAINVDVRMTDIRWIEALYKDPNRLFVEVYCIWKMNLTPPLTWLTVVNILELMLERKLTEELRDNYVTTTDS